MDVKYEYDTRQGMRRKDDDGANGCLAAFVLFLVIGLLLGIITAFARQANEQARMRPTMDSMSYTRTSDGSMIKVYVVTDPDTGVQYVVSDRGGICVRERNDEQ